MKFPTVLLGVLMCSLLLRAEPDTKEITPDGDPAQLHQAAMAQLQKMSNTWMDLAGKTGASRKKNLFIELADSYAAYKRSREERYEAEKNQEAIHYEKLIELENRIQFLEKEAEEVLGQEMPKRPREIKVRTPPPAPVKPTPLPPARYTTESGFEVQLLLED